MPNPLLNLIITGLLAGLGMWLFWPEKGLFWRWQRTRQMTRRVLMEDALKRIHHSLYHGRRPTMQSIAGALHISIDKAADLLTEMQTHGLVTFEGDGFDLTAQGRDYALHIIRAHRLWERYLADKTGFDAAVWHTQSERREHELTRSQTEALSAELGDPCYDPHGDPIPTANGRLLTLGIRQSLVTLPPHQPGRIVHLEDEPDTVYAQLLAEGLHLGMQVLVIEVTPQRVQFWADGDEHVLAPIVAANISVVPIRQTEELQASPRATLSQLRPGEAARVTDLSPRCLGAERRRLMDLGILPGTLITAEMVSPSGDPTAYRIRGAVIGLRHEQASLIHVTRNLDFNQRPQTSAEADDSPTDQLQPVEANA